MWMGAARLTPAWVAWLARNEPHLGVAKTLTCHAVGSATTANREGR